MASAPGDLEKAEASRTDYPNSNQTTENSDTRDVDVKNSKNAARLTKIFITSCVLGVFLDPLFLYIPLLNHDLKCLRLDNTIKIIALVSRLFTDLFYVGRIILQVCRFENCSPFMNRILPKSCSSKLITSFIKCFRELLPEVTEVHEKEYLIPSITKEIRESSIIVDILAILPLPQVAILIFFPKMRVSGSFGKRIMNFLVMVQYVPRVLRIYLSCKKARKPFKGQIPLWLKGLLNLFLYILASHVLGAFWYFFAAQQMISCWEHACLYGNGCGAITFNCHDHQTLKNITVLNDFCPINPPDTTPPFNFGIYLNVLQSGALWSTDYPLKFLNSFCWGLRNLSSLASNLQPSFYTWEIAFVAFISIIGLILFVYLIGNLQTYVLIDTERLESHRRENKLKRKLKENDRKVESWLSGHGIPLSRKQKIMEEIKRELEENSDFDVVREILSILPLEEIKSYSPLSRLRKVPLLKDMDEGVLVEISEKLHPEKYTPGKIIINKDETLEMMLFIVDGSVIIEKTDGSQLEHLGPGDFYGEELLVSPLWTSSSDAKPINQSVQAIDDVQALVLSATDMATLSFSSRRHINELRMVVTILQKVPKLQTMDKQVLKAMSHHLSPVSYKRDDYIVRENQPVSRMFFITRGEVTKNENPPEANFIGEELLEWVLDKSFPTILPLSTCTVRVVSNDAEVLILKARMLKNVVSKFMKHFSNFASLSDIRLTWLKKVEIFQQMDEQVLEAICKCLKHMNFNVAKRHILQEKKPLKMMFFVIRGVVLIESDSALEENVKNTCEIGSFYGEELVQWVTTWVHKSFPAKLPLSPGSALCSVRGGPVEILALKADDLKSVVSEFRSKFSTETTLPTDSDQPRELTILKNVEILKTMNEEVLKEVCKHLTEKTYKDEYIIMKDKQMEMMFFIVSGVVSVTNENSKHYLREGERPNHSGDELIQRWVRSKSASVSAELPTSPSSFWAIGEVEVLILKAEDLASVQLGDRIG
ncbi:cyclic nucleotide-gated ion channel 1-like isoform X3 [Prunus dulcis]|nr:cyclic nucleotide-gated ion channel 1-like isoform X3 [Prunus dulcis]